MSDKLKIEFGSCDDSEICTVQEARQGLTVWFENTPPEKRGDYIKETEVCSGYPNSRCKRPHIWEAVAQRVEGERYQVVSLEVREMDKAPLSGLIIIPGARQGRAMFGATAPKPEARPVLS